MINKITKLFESEIGKKIYTIFLNTIHQNGICRMLSKGVIVGFSGGPDSVMLLCLLYRYFGNDASSKIKAVHVNHMIRGEEADRDEKFSCEFAKNLQVEFLSSALDIPSIAKKQGIGIEEAARNARYAHFEKIINGRNDVSCIAVAHNATDNVETVLFNMMRGAGSKGISGIPPVRDRIVRPLISVSKQDIISALRSVDIPYVTDSTNLSSDYSRNFIRNNILPLMRNMTSDLEASFARISSNLRKDNEFLELTADSFLSKYTEDKIPSKELAELHPSVFCRVLRKMMYDKCRLVPEQNHIEKIYQLLKKDEFKYSLPGNIRFACRGGYSYLEDDIEEEYPCFETKLLMGINVIKGINGAVVISENKISDIVSDSYSNVYKISIQQCIYSAIIKGELFVRNKKDGDAYKYSNITHKLKKLFNDRGIPPEKRPLVPVICDGDGIVWVPSFGVRQSAEISSKKKIYIGIGCSVKENKDPKFYIANKFKN